MRRHLLKSAVLLCSLLSPFLLSAQYNIPENNTWAMGQKCGIDFNTNPPTAITTAISSFEGSAAVCNSNGQLLFYTNGTDIWTASGNLMPNGATINNVPYHTASSTQGAVIVPDPANTNRYYLFSCAGTGLYVNVVDMTLNNGAGDVDVSYALHGVRLVDTMTEKMVAVRGCNKNVWVLTRSMLSPKPHFMAFEVSGAGVDTVPVTSDVSHFAMNAYFQGQMKVSPDKKKVAIANASGIGLELFDFDYASGRLSNAMTPDSALTNVYGCAFSPNSSRLYALTVLGEIWQYDMNNPNPATAKVMVGTGGFTSQMQLAVDGKIYFRSGFFPAGNSSLGRINNPDITGTGCGLQNPVSSLVYPNVPNTGLQLGLSNEVVKADSEIEPPANRHYFDTAVCVREGFAGFALYAMPGFTNYVWDNSGTGSTRNVFGTGIYWVRYMTDCGPRTDTFRVSVTTIVALQLEFINGILSTGQAYATYQWYKAGVAIPGATGQSLTVSDTGWYSLRVTHPSGCTDSAAYHVTTPTGIRDHDIARAGISVYPNPVQDVLHIQSKNKIYFQLLNLYGRTVRSSDQSTVSLRDLPAGLYMLKLFDRRDDRLIGIRKISKR